VTIVGTQCLVWPIYVELALEENELMFTFVRSLKSVSPTPLFLFLLDGRRKLE